jgi:predicted porin
VGRLLHECNGKAFYSPNLLEMSEPSGAIDATFLIGGWLRSAFGAMHRLNPLDPCLTLEKLAMKKTLIALATLAATGAFAQSTVTMSGVMDFAAASVSGTQANVKGTTISQSLGQSATSVIRITAVEDLGGGMKATAHYGLDPRGLSNDAAPLGRDELFVGVSGGFGNIRLGSPNSIGLTTFLAGSPLGTGVGSGYAATAMDYSNIRYSRSARYDSPAFSGVTLSVLYAPGNDQAVTTGAPAQLIANARNVTEIGLRYANGPLTVAFANVAQAAQTNATAAAKTSSNILAASYALGATVLSAGWNDGKALAAAATAQKSTGYRLGVAHTMGAITLGASQAEQKTNLIKETVTGLRADYALSKRSAVYAGYEIWDNKKATMTDKVNSGDRKIMSIGVRHAF